MKFKTYFTCTLSCAIIAAGLAGGLWYFTMKDGNYLEYLKEIPSTCFGCNHTLPAEQVWIPPAPSTTAYPRSIGGKQAELHLRYSRHTAGNYDIIFYANATRAGAKYLLKMHEVTNSETALRDASGLLQESRPLLSRDALWEENSQRQLAQPCQILGDLRGQKTCPYAVKIEILDAETQECLAEGFYLISGDEPTTH